MRPECLKWAILGILGRLRLSTHLHLHVAPPPSPPYPGGSASRQK